jgi:beta-galactosidase/beta-glucuronidase
MHIHRIRLRGPWKFQWLSDPKPDPESGRASLPQEWRELFGTNAGRVRFQRTFHAPTNLEPTSQVNLVFEGIGGDCRVSLNDREFGGQEGASRESMLRFDITEGLLPSNDLRIEVQFLPNQTTQPGGLWGMVVLEIVEASFGGKPSEPANKPLG